MPQLHTGHHNQQRLCCHSVSERKIYRRFSAQVFPQLHLPNGIQSPERMLCLIAYFLLFRSRVFQGHYLHILQSRRHCRSPQYRRYARSLRRRTKTVWFQPCRRPSSRPLMTQQCCWNLILQSQTALSVRPVARSASSRWCSWAGWMRWRYGFSCRRRSFRYASPRQSARWCRHTRRLRPICLSG